MTEILTPLINQDIDYKYSRIYKPFRFYSDILDCEVTVPPEFVHDYESVPIFRGSSKKGGVGHDYLSRKDSVPVVTKKVAAQVYFEVMEYVNVTEVPRNAWFRRFRFWWRRWLKYGVVRVWPGYFHKHKVMATYEEMSGRKEHKIQDAGSMMQDSGSRIQETD